MAYNLFLSVVVPVYNEAEALPKFVEKLSDAFAEYRRPWEVVFVDDGSSDGTAEQLRDLRLTRKNVKVITLDQNYGREAALCAGFHFSEGTLVVQIPADLQYDPGDISKLLDAALTSTKPDFVTGYCTNTVPTDDLSARKIDAMRLASKTERRLKDPLCSLRLYGKSLIDRAESYNGNTYSPTELLPRMSKRPMEVAVTRSPRVAGKNKLPRGIKTLPPQTLSTWNTFDVLSMTAISAGIVIALASVLSGFVLPVFHGGNDELMAMMSRLSLVLMIIGLVSGLALSAAGLAMRKIVVALLPLPEPIRYNTTGQPPPPPRSSREYRGRGRSQRKPRDNAQKTETDKPTSNGKSAPAEKPKPTGPVTLESVVLNDDNRSNGTDRTAPRQHPRATRDDQRNNDRRQSRDSYPRRGPSSTYDPDN